MIFYTARYAVQRRCSPAALPPDGPSKIGTNFWGGKDVGCNPLLYGGDEHWKLATAWETKCSFTSSGAETLATSIFSERADLSRSLAENLRRAHH